MHEFTHSDASELISRPGIAIDNEIPGSNPDKVIQMIIL